MLDSTLDNFITKFKFSLHIPSFIINIRTTPGLKKNHFYGLIIFLLLIKVKEQFLRILNIDTSNINTWTQI